MDHNFWNFQTILNKYKVINVPYYQREYVWGVKNDGRNLYKFIDDIFTQYKETPEGNYFIGTLAFCSDELNDVIDGQQRLTSLILILTKLAQLKCSKIIKEKHKKILFPNNDNQFVIQEENYLTEELKCFLGYPNHFDTQGKTAGISKTIDRITSQINNAWSGKTESWYDGLYNFILNKVMFISLEYTNIGDSLKYFLNINSLSIPLTQSDIFYSIFSQALRISKSTDSIFNIKEKVAKLAANKGFEKDIDEYKKSYEKEEKNIDNVIYIFLNALYQTDPNILSLNEAGIGKWMSFYKTDVFKDAITAKDFVDKFNRYLNDLNYICDYFTNKVGLDSKSSIYISWILLQYENYFDILKFLVELFKTRHNYIDGKATLYVTGTNNIDNIKLEEIATRLNLTLINNYIRSNNKRMDGFITNIKLTSSGDYALSLNDILDNIDFDSIFNLNYNDHKEKGNTKIKDESRIIKVIFALQESFLNYVAAGKSKTIGEYLNNILSLAESFSIEHLYSVKEYEDTTRLANWNNKKSKFKDGNEFDVARFNFANLSLLNKSLNSSVNDSEILDKLQKYKTARKINGCEWEYLIQSLVKDSEYYLNTEISKLCLPERTIINIDQNTWEISPNNREFNIKLLKLVVEEISK